MPEQDYTDPHRWNPNVHYRLYRSPQDEQPTVICVQDFDYYDYDASRFLSRDAWDCERDAEEALALLVSDHVPGIPGGAIVADHLKPGDFVHLVMDPRDGTVRVVKA